MFSKQKIRIAIAGVATASFATGFIGAEQGLKQQAEAEIAQPLQPALYGAAQRALWHGDTGLNYVDQQVQLARRQSAIAQSRYFNSRMHDQANRREPDAGDPSWSTSSRSAAVQSDQLDVAQDPTGELLTAPLDLQVGATADTTATTVPGSSMSDASTEQMERYTSESAEYSTSADHRLEPEVDAHFLKPDFAWSGSPEFVKDYIKISAIK